MILGLENIPFDVTSIVLFGCTNDSITIKNFLVCVFDRAKIIYFDNYYSGDSDSCFHEIPVVKPNIDISYDCYVIYSEKYADKMIKQLIDMGIDKEKICLTANIINLRYEKIVKKRVPLGNRIDFLVIDIVEHCNLNCQNCDHFSPISEPEYLDPDDYEGNIKKLAALLSNSGVLLGELCLEGGEPFLHPQINRIIKISRKYFSQCKISIYSNGTLCLKQSEDTWKLMRECNVGLEITKYPIDFDYSSVESKCIEEHVRFNYFGGTNCEKTSVHKPLDLNGNQNKYKSFHECYMGNGMCTVFKDGKIYPCTMAPNIYHFNSYFKKNIAISERDYLLISQCESGEQILDFLANPIPACRYCKVQEWTYGHKWATTKKDIREWT